MSHETKHEMCAEESTRNSAPREERRKRGNEYRRIRKTQNERGVTEIKCNQHCVLLGKCNKQVQLEVFVIMRHPGGMLKYKYKHMYRQAKGNEVQ